MILENILKKGILFYLKVYNGINSLKYFDKLNLKTINYNKNILYYKRNYKIKIKFLIKLYLKRY